MKKYKKEVTFFLQLIGLAFIAFLFAWIES